MPADIIHSNHSSEWPAPTSAFSSILYFFHPRNSVLEVVGVAGVQRGVMGLVHGGPLVRKGPRVCITLRNRVRSRSGTRTTVGDRKYAR
jgi:hypothetical protein